MDKSNWIKKEKRKHRYIYILAGKKHKKKIMNTLKHETLPYPKSRDTDESKIINEINCILNPYFIAFFMCSKYVSPTE